MSPRSSPSTPTAAVAEPLRMSFAEFLIREDVPEHSEWVRGEVVPMAAVRRAHSSLAIWLTQMLDLYCEESRVGEVQAEPYQMHLAAVGTSRAPDAMVILDAHLERAHDTHLDGPADLVIEIISPGSRRRDTVEKFGEYEQAGVPEYWILDPERQEALFYTLTDGAYEALQPDASGRLESRVIPGLWLQVDWLWERPSGVELLRAWGIIP